MKQKHMVPDLSRFSKDELCEIYHRLNSSKWDKRLGVPPAKWIKYFVMGSIEKKIGMRQILKHHHMNNLGRSEEDFEKWYEITVSNAIFGINQSRR